LFGKFENILEFIRGSPFEDIAIEVDAAKSLQMTNHISRNILVDEEEIQHTRLTQHLLKTKEVGSKGGG